MKIGFLQKTSLIEYPGKIGAVVFTQGCNFGCPYCHNPELVDPLRFTEPVPPEEILSFLKKRKGMLEAVTVTGGEPCIQQGLVRFIEDIGNLGYLVKLDTNGSMPEVLAEIIEKGLADYLAMDIKAPLRKYHEISGRPDLTRMVESSIRIVMSSNVPYEFRTTLDRMLLCPEDIIEIGNTIKGASRYVLQRFVPSKHLDPVCAGHASFTGPEIEDLVGRLRSLVLQCIVR